MAQSRHAWLHRTCPLSGVKRTSLFAPHMSAFEPKRTAQTFSFLTVLKFTDEALVSLVCASGATGGAKCATPGHRSNRHHKFTTAECSACAAHRHRRPS